MKRILLLSSLIFLTFTSPKIFALDNGTVVGNYELQGMMETAGLLMLKAKQKYEAQFSYGAADWIETGTWKLEGDEVVLKEGHFKVKNYPDLPLFFPSDTRLKFENGKLTASNANGKAVFVNPNKTPSPPQSAENPCIPFKDPTLKLVEGSLLAVEKNQVVINDVMMHQDITVRRSWADKNIPTMLIHPNFTRR